MKNEKINNQASLLVFWYDNIRLREYFGLKAFIWFYILIVILAVGPLYIFGKSVSNIVHDKYFKSAFSVQEKNISHPEYMLSRTQTLNLRNGERELYLQVSNTIKPDIGYYPWNYTKQVVDRFGNVIQEDFVVDYLLPNEEKFILSTSKNEDAAEINIITNKETSIPLLYNPSNSKYLSLPDLQIYQKVFFNSQYDSDKIDITIGVRNPSPDIVVRNLTILIIMRNIDQVPVGIAKMRLPVINNKSEEQVILKNYPKPKIGEIDILDVRLEYNYMEEDSLQIR